MRNFVDKNRPALRAAAKQGWVFLCVLCWAAAGWGQSIRVTPDNLEAGIRALRHSRGPLTVTFAAGNYFLSKPIEIASAGGPVVIQADAGAAVVLSGGVPITGWKTAMLNGHDCWMADMPGVRIGRWNFRELWVNGKRATRSRYPATGCLASVIPQDDKTPWNQGQNWFGYIPGDIPADLPAADVEAVVMNRWEESRLAIKTIDDVNHRMQCWGKSVFQLQDGDPYWLEGSSRWLDQPGEWYLDRHQGTLYYLPRAGEQMAAMQAVAPHLEALLKMDRASHVTFRGLTFSHSEWNLPEQSALDESQVGGFAQAAVGVPAAVSLQHCRDCRFESCTFEHLGNFGLELGRGCRGNAVDHCTFTDFGAGAIKIGETDPRDEVMEQTCRNTVIDCKITDGGRMFPSAPGIWIGQSYDNNIEHNEIADLYYTGISVGWTWGYGPSQARGNHFTANLIHHIGKRSDGEGPLLSDMGGIYALGNRAGTVISGNVFHHIAGRVYGGWGIYLDEGSSDVLVEKNLVYRTTHGGFHVNYGRDNIVQNNIFAFGRDLQIARTRVESTQSFSFERNLVYWDTGIFTATDPAGLKFDNNVYNCVGGGRLQFSGKSWDQWRAAGEDTHSILADPGFTDPAHFDFTIKADSPARAIGFEPLDLRSVGIRPKNVSSP